MLKRLLVITSLLVLLTACQKSTDPQDSPLIGTWGLSTMKVGGAVVARSDYSGVPIKLLFSYTSNGTIWYENYGKTGTSASFVWNTGGTTLSLQVTGENMKSYTYSVSDSTLTITDLSNYQYIYAKRQ